MWQNASSSSPSVHVGRRRPPSREPRYQGSAFFRKTLNFYFSAEHPHALAHSGQTEPVAAERVDVETVTVVTDRQLRGLLRPAKHDRDGARATVLADVRQA